jgi:TatD DNase family protein
MEWIDTHCHYDFPQFDVGREDLNTRLCRQRVLAVINPGVERKNWARIAARVENRENTVRFYAAYGIHPCFVLQHTHDDLQALSEWLAFHPAVAVGEIGLDRFDDTVPFASQMDFFEAQLEIAVAYHLPVILHVRRAHGHVLSVLRHHSGIQGGVVHAYSGSIETARNYLDLGFVVGLGGAVTYARSVKVRKMVSALPDSGYVLETDAPDMVPAFVSGAQNSPLYLPGIASEVANLRGQSIEQVAQDSTDNAHRVFPGLEALK